MPNIDDKICHVDEFSKIVRGLKSEIGEMETTGRPPTWPAAAYPEKLPLRAILYRDTEVNENALRFSNWVSHDIERYIALKMLSIHDSRIVPDTIYLENHLDLLFNEHGLPDSRKLAEEVAGKIAAIIDKDPIIQPPKKRFTGRLAAENGKLIPFTPC